jgi:hypothetical protein
VPASEDPESTAPLALRPDDLTWTTTDEGVTVLDVRTARYLQLNRSGATLWERLSAGATLDELADSLCARFGIDVERARADAEEFVNVLRERDLLVN